jgi:hypothetical protein
MERSKISSSSNSSSSGSDQRRYEELYPVYSALPLSWTEISARWRSQSAAWAGGLENCRCGCVGAFQRPKSELSGCIGMLERNDELFRRISD